MMIPRPEHDRSPDQGGWSIVPKMAGRRKQDLVVARSKRLVFGVDVVANRAATIAHSLRDTFAMSHPRMLAAFSR
jgi:hypothetical protein